MPPVLRSICINGGGRLLQGVMHMQKICPLIQKPCNPSCAWYCFFPNPLYPCNGCALLKISTILEQLSRKG